MKDNLSDVTSKINVRIYDNVKTKNKKNRYVVLPVSVVAGHSRGAVKACGSG